MVIVQNVVVPISFIVRDALSVEIAVTANVDNMLRKLTEFLGTAVGLNFVLSAISWLIGGVLILAVLLVLFFMGKL